MIQSDLISSTEYEFTEYKSNMPGIFNNFNNYVIDWLDLDEDEYDHPVDTVFYGKINFDVKGVKYNKFYIDIADKRYIILDDSVSIETVKSIAESFRDVYMLGWK